MDSPPNTPCGDARGAGDAHSDAPGADAGHGLWFLIGLVGQSSDVKSVPICASPFTVGRRHDQQLCLATQTVSGRHAEIIEEHDCLSIRDLGSTNGTFVNGRRINQVTVLAENDLVQFADLAFRVRHESGSFETHTLSEHLCDQALSLVQFDKLMNDRAVSPYYQPIVDMKTRDVVGFEVLARSRIYGLQMPAAMFQAAAQLNLTVELSRLFRTEGVRSVASLPQLPLLFVNTHPRELADPNLFESLRATREANPNQPLVLEVHEAAITSAGSMRDLRKVLDELKILLAYDDFGAGQNRLVELIEVPPDFLKFDMALVRDIDQSPQRQQMLATLVKMTGDLRIVNLAEGIETEAEAVACREIGFDLAQGFLFGRPSPVSRLTSTTILVSSVR